MIKLSILNREIPGIESIGSLTFLPSITNIGKIKSSTETRCSLINFRENKSLRNRLGRFIIFS